VFVARSLQPDISRPSGSRHRGQGMLPSRTARIRSEYFMKTSLLRLIRCPDCGAALGLVNARGQNAEIVSGILQCEGCRSSFPIEDGLPVILRCDALSERTRRSFGKQWKLHEQRRCEHEPIYVKNWREVRHDFQRAFELADLASLQDFMILDAGCGSGVLTADL